MPWKNWGDHPIVVGIGTIGVLVGLAYTIYDHHLKQEDTSKNGVVSSKPSDSVTPTPSVLLSPTPIASPSSVASPAIDPSSSPQAKPSPANPNASSTTIDYSILEGLLKRGEWRNADQATSYLMLNVANKNARNWLGKPEITNFPCEVLSKIDDLWFNNSQGKFGFRVHRKIYIENFGGNPDGQINTQAWWRFNDKVGWLVKDKWLTYSDLTFNIQAPEGHLPSVVLGPGRGSASGFFGVADRKILGFHFLQRLSSCSI